jgi:RecJ-like exonuclease
VINDIDDEEGGYCPQCSGSGEGMYDGSRCSACGGSGEVSSGPSREDYEADKADYLNDLVKDERYDRC